MRKSLVFSISLILAILLYGCKASNAVNEKNNHEGTVVITQLQQDASITPEVIVTPIEQIIQSKNNIISFEDLRKYLLDKKSDVIINIGSGYDTGTMAVIESHMEFPSIFDKKSGITFIFPNDTDDLEPNYLCINKEVNLNEISVKGAKPGMLFKDIIDKLGELEIIKTWISSEYIDAYHLDYTYDGILFSFVSYEEDGEASELYISME